MVVKVSSRLGNRVKQITSSNEPQQYQTDCVLHNPESEFKYKVRAVKSFNVTQGFDTDYMDTMFMTIEVTPDEYKALAKNFTGLRCTLILRPVTTQLHVRYDIEPIIVDAVVLIPEMEDMEKNLGAAFIESDGPKRAYQHDLYGPLEIQLVEPKAHELRHKQLVATFGDTTVEPILHWAAMQFGAESCKIKKPDNSTTYNNFIIPPMKDISNLFPFIQTRYGIYSKGLGYYFTKGVFYIYPIYDTEAANDDVDSSTVHVIAATGSGLTGKINHKFIDKDIWIVTSDLKTKSMNTMTSENYGTAMTSLKADTMRDQEVIRSPDGKITRNPDDILIIQQNNKGGRTSNNMQNMKYAESTSNAYVQTSEMARNDGTYGIFTWTSAFPWAFTPGQKVVVHYDGTASNYNVQKGTILNATYVSKSMKDSGLTNPTLRFIATVTVKLDSDYQSGDNYQYT